MRKLLATFVYLLCFMLCTSMVGVDFLGKSEFSTIQTRAQSQKLDSMEVLNPSSSIDMYRPPPPRMPIKMPQPMPKGGNPQPPKQPPPKQQPTPKQQPAPKQQPKEAAKGSHDNNKRESNREKHENADARRQKEQRKAEEKREKNKKKHR